MTMCNDQDIIQIFLEHLKKQTKIILGGESKEKSEALDDEVIFFLNR